jgi:hypothetical protein
MTSSRAEFIRHQKTVIDWKGRAARRDDSAGALAERG